MKIKRLFTVFLLVLSVTISSANAAQATAAPPGKAVWGALGGIIGFGLIFAAFAGLNLQQVSNDSDLEHCDPNNTEYTYQPCHLHQFYNDWSSPGLWAILGTLAPSADAPIDIVQPVVLLYFVFSDINKIRQASNRYQSGTTGQAAFEIVTSLMAMGFAIFEGISYGVGDQYGAKTVGETVAKTSAFNDYCKNRDHYEECAADAEGIFHEKTNATWRNPGYEATLGEWYRVLNRVGSFFVGYTLGYAMAIPFKLTLQEALVMATVNGKYQISQPEGHKVFRILRAARAVSSAFFIISPWNPIKQYSAPLFNTVEYNKMVLSVLDNADITYNQHGILHHRLDPNASSYIDLSYAGQSAQFLLDNNFVTEELINKIQKEQKESGVGMYRHQYHLVTAAAANNLLALPENLMAFKPAFHASKAFFAVDILWNVVTLACLIPYDINLFSFEGTKQANETQSYQALVDLAKDNQRSEDDLLSNQFNIILANVIIINSAWALSISPRFTNLPKAFEDPLFLKPTTLPMHELQQLDSGLSQVPVPGLDHIKPLLK